MKKPTSNTGPPLALALPDQLLVHYFRAGELAAIANVVTTDDKIAVDLAERTDRWRDLGGGLGFVPETE